MIEENNESTGTVEQSADESRKESRQSELTAQDILAASVAQTESSAAPQDAVAPAGISSIPIQALSSA